MQLPGWTLVALVAGEVAKDMHLGDRMGLICGGTAVDPGRDRNVPQVGENLIMTKRTAHKRRQLLLLGTAWMVVTSFAQTAAPAPAAACCLPCRCRTSGLRGEYG